MSFQEELEQSPVTLKLERIIGFAMISSDDERSQSVKGYYLDKNIAEVKAKGAGWYGGNGHVEPRVLYIDSGGQLYEMKSLGIGADKSSEIRQNIMESLKSKLSPEEWEFISKNGLPTLPTKVSSL